MFCDLVGSTALSEQLDPEDWREIVRAYQAAGAAVISRYEGRVAQYLSDGLLVYFGYPTAHEDDAQRAVHTGLGIVEAMPALPLPRNVRLPQPLQVRIGIHTGPVVVGEMGGGDKRELLALGETPNIAARVQGEAQRKAGEHLVAQETLLRAADSARALGATESFVHAGLELAWLAHEVGLSVAPAVCLLEEALQGLGMEDSLLTAQTLGGLARVLGATGAEQQAMVYAQQAVAMARRLANSELLAANLLVMIYALQGPEHTQQRLAYASEMLQLAEAANVKEVLSHAHYWCAFCSLELGDMPATDAEIDAYARLVEVQQQPLYLYISVGFRAARALMQGRFADSERLAQEALAMGQHLQTENVAGIFGLQMFTLRREQGRLKELEPIVRYFVQQHSAAAAWRPGLTLIYSELGRAQEARAEFEYLAQHDFADLPRDGLWMACLTYLADVCTFLGDATRATTLYQLLLPYAGRNVVVGNAAACYGALSRYLGALATTLGRWDEAAQHFEDALAMNARMEARPWLAHTQYQYATMLLARDQPGDSAKAVELLKAALVTARELGMRALEERLTVPVGTS
jgi:class 3 adenylate cyclase